MSAAARKSIAIEALLPLLSSEGVRWRTQASAVRIEIDLLNAGLAPTLPAQLVVEAALFGAFADGYPVGAIAVGALEPGEQRRVALDIEFSDLPALRADPLSDQTLRALEREGFTGTAFGRFHGWAGNVGVWFDGDPTPMVHVHRSPKIELIEGGSTGVAFYLPPERSGYDFEVRSSEPGWRALVFRNTESQAALVVRAPRAGAHTHVDVDVIRRSDRSSVRVEFEFDSIEVPFLT
jgi:hypothetical protein